MGKHIFLLRQVQKKIRSFIFKEKMYFSDQGTDYLEIHQFQYVLSPKMAPQIGQIFKMLKMQKWANFWRDFGT